MVSRVGTVDFVKIAKSDEMSWKTTSLYLGCISGFILELPRGESLKGREFYRLAAKVQVIFRGCCPGDWLTYEAKLKFFVTKI